MIFQSLNKTEAAAVMLMAAVFILNVTMRLFPQQIGLYGSEICLTLLATSIAIISTGITRGLAIAGALLMASLIVDIKFFNPNGFQVNEVVSIIGALAAGITLLLRTKNNLKISWCDALLVLALIIKYATHNSTAKFNGREIYFMGDACTHFLFALILFLKLVDKTQVVPIIMLSGTTINLVDELFADPMNLHPGEIIVMVLVIVNLIWWELRKHFANTSERKKNFFHVFIALQLLIFIGGFILLLKSIR